MFEGLRDHVNKRIFGKQGGLTHGDVIAKTRRTKLSEFLPYNFYDDDKGRFHSTDDTLGYIWECTPLYFPTKTITKDLKKFLQMRYPSDVVISFHLYADPHLLDIVDAYKANKIRDDVVLRKSADEFAQFILAGSSGLQKMAHLPVRNFRLFVSLKCVTGLSDDLLSNVEDSLNACRFNPVRLDDKQLRTLLVRLINSYDNQPLKDKIDKTLPIRHQLIQADSHLKFPYSGFSQIGKRHAACLTHFSVPDETDPLIENRLLGGYMGSEDDTNQISSPFIYSTIITFTGVEEEVATKARIMNGQALVGDRARELGRRLSEFNWIQDLPEGERNAKVLQTLWIFDEDEKKLQTAVSRAKRIADGFDYEYMQETILAPTLFVASLPLGYYNIKGNAEIIDRYRILPTSSIATILPIQSDFTGSCRTVAGKMPASKTPVLLSVGRKGQLQGIDVFDKRSDNYNFFITAASGAGKSVNLNKIITDYFNSGAMVRAVDIGYSLEKTCMINKGRFLDIGKEHIIFNPFYSQGNDTEDLAKDILACTNVLAEMVYSASGGALSEIEWTLLKAASEHVFKLGDINEGIDRTREFLSDPETYLKDDPVSDVPEVLHVAKKMGFNMRDFGKQGLFGKYFNGPSNFNIANDELVVLELQQLKDQKDLFSVIVMQVVNSVTQDLYLSDRTSRRFVLFEEAAHYLKEQGHRDLSRLAAIIEEGYRRARKHKGSFGTVLQSILDLELFGPIGKVLRSNAAFKIYMASDDYELGRDKKLIDKDGLAFELIDSVKNHKPNYSEVYWETPFGQGVGRLVLDAWNYWVATSDGDEFAAYKACVERGMSPAQALSHLSGVPL